MIDSVLEGLLVVQLAALREPRGEVNFTPYFVNKAIFSVIIYGTGGMKGNRPVSSTIGFYLALCGVLMCLLPLGCMASPFPDMLSTTDRDRLSRYEPVRRATLQHVRQHVDEVNAFALSLILEGSASDIPASQLTGEWSCNTIRLRRTQDHPMTVSPRFSCLITEERRGLRLQQLTGTRRTSGVFHDIGETRLGYVGAFALDGETTAPRYGERADRNHVGYLIPLSLTRMRLEFPLPSYDSEFDILELRRPNPVP